MSIKLFKNGSLHVSGAYTLEYLREVVYSFCAQIGDIIPGVEKMEVAEIKVVMLNTHITTGVKLNVPNLHESF